MRSQAMSVSAIDRIRARLAETPGPLPSPCWVWTGARNNHGYGVARVDGLLVLVHRYVYTELVGPIPAGLELDHGCRVRDCANPAHCEPLTHAEHCRRSARAMQTHCLRGHEYTPANTRYPAGRTARCCQRCGRDQAREKVGIPRRRWAELERAYQKRHQLLSPA